MTASCLGPDELATTDAIIDRDEEAFALRAALSRIGLNNIHIFGPRGSGKTSLVHTILDDLPSDVSVYYLSCDDLDTQYSVLKALYPPLLGYRLDDGYHVADLQRELAPALAGDKTVIVLDEVDFLLLNDGEDLLYYLSRLEKVQLSVITISASQANLSDALDTRTYSSLYPQQVSFDPYSVDEATQILEAHADTLVPVDPPPTDALYAMSSCTTNTRFLVCWLAVAAEASDSVTPDTIHRVKPAARQQFRDRLLDPFSTHHHTLLEAIERLTAETEPVTAEAVYDRYQTVCESIGQSALSSRRISDFIKHLELLGVIEVDYHYGGRKGKTREIRLQEI